jgi:RNA polymerase sigma factor (sigma-70 family)
MAIESSGVRGTERVVLVTYAQDRLVAEALTVAVAQISSIAAVERPVPLRDAAGQCRRLRPDLLLVDISSDEHRSLGALGAVISSVSPSTRLIVVVDRWSDEALVEAVEAGAVGFVCRTGPLEDLAEAVRAVVDGRNAIDGEGLVRSLSAAAEAREERRAFERRLERLTARERDILDLIAEGLRNDDIARRLHISVRTVDTHIRNVLGKLDVHSKLKAMSLLRRLDEASPKAHTDAYAISRTGFSAKAPMVGRPFPSYRAFPKGATAL